MKKFPFSLFGLGLALFAPSLPASAAVDCSDDVVTYRVVAGDTLSRIAADAYGDSSHWPRISEYPGNTDAIGGNPNRLSIGTELAIPPCPGAVTSADIDLSRLRAEASDQASTSMPIIVYVVTGDDWPPYVDTSWPQKGMVTQIVEAAFEASSIGDQVRLHIVNDWSAQLNVLGPHNRYQLTFPWFMPDMDFWQTCGRLPEDMQIRCKYEKSSPIATATVAFFKESGRADLRADSFEDLDGKSLCRPAGYSTFELEENGLSASNVVRAATPTECFSRMLQGQVDYVILNRFTGKTVAAGMGIENQVEMADVSIPNTLHLLAYRDNPMNTVSYLDEFNAGLRKIIDSGIYAQIVSFHNDEFNRQVNAN